MDDDIEPNPVPGLIGAVMLAWLLGALAAIATMFGAFAWLAPEAADFGVLGVAIALPVLGVTLLVALVFVTAAARWLRQRPNLGTLALGGVALAVGLGGMVAVLGVSPVMLLDVAGAAFVTVPVAVGVIVGALLFRAFALPLREGWPHRRR